MSGDASRRGAAERDRDPDRDHVPQRGGAAPGAVAPGDAEPGPAEPGLAGGGGAGAERARRALEEARAARARVPTDEERIAAAARRAELRRQRSGRRRKAGDPVAFAAAIDALLAARGWQAQARMHGVLTRWEEIAGPELAAHCRPVSLREGELTLVAESTAWATQLRLLEARVRDRVNADLGAGVVKRLRVHGPTSTRQLPAGSWRVAGGRGPRDTYG